MGPPIAPDGTATAVTTPTHYHCYKWSGSGQEWDRIGRTDTLDVNSPDRPPVRTNDWLIKSPKLIAAVHTTPEGARDWLIDQWQLACKNAINPVPDWVDVNARAALALQAITSAHWPTYSQWLRGGTLVIISVIGTHQHCH